MTAAIRMSTKQHDALMAVILSMVCRHIRDAANDADLAEGAISHETYYSRLNRSIEGGKSDETRLADLGLDRAAYSERIQQSLAKWTD